MNTRTSFFSLGLSSTMLAFPATSLFYCADYINNFVETSHLKNKPSYTSFSQGIKKQVFNSWFESYINDCQTLTEKKYKAIFAQIWLSSYKDTYVVDNFTFRQKLYQINKDLKTETTLEVSNLLDNTYRGVRSFSFIVEDLHKQENIMIAKAVADDFIDQGLIARNVKNFYASDIKTLSFVYDNKLSKKDISYLITKTKQYKTLEPMLEIFKNANIKIIVSLDTTILENIIKDEEVIKNLEVLQKYFNIVYKQNDIKEKLSNLIIKKTNYIVLSKQLQEKQSHKNQVIKKI